MTFRKFRQIAALALMLFITMSVGQIQAQSNAGFLRAVNFLGDAFASPPTLDIYVDGEIALSRLAFSDATAYISLPTGEHQLDYGVQVDGVSTPSGNAFSIEVLDQDLLTFVISGAIDDAHFYALSERDLATSLGLELSSTTMPLLFVNAALGIGDVDVYINGTLAGTAAEEHSTLLLVPLSAAKYSLQVTPAGVAPDDPAIPFKATIDSLTLSNVLGVAGFIGSADSVQIGIAYSSFSTALQFLSAQNADTGISFGTLLTAVSTAGLDETLAAPGALTILAPDDSAFAKLDATVLSGLLEDPTALANVIKYHVFGNTVQFRDLMGLMINNGTQTTLQGTEMTFAFGNAKLSTLGGVETDLLAYNIHTSNATLYIIDSVLIPPTP